jgi:RNA ligase
MFPQISDLSTFQSKVKHLPEINFRVNEHGFTIGCYSINTGSTFTSENSEFARECRGIVFGPDGKLVSRPFHKFFNVGELTETLIDNLDFSKIVRLMDKRDGSMVHPVKIGGLILFSTKKSFYSDVAIDATKLLHSYAFGDYLLFSDFCISKNITPIFEYTSPKWRIVLDYQNEFLTLLHVRDNFTGQYYSSQEIDALILESGKQIKKVDEYPIDQNTKQFLLDSIEDDSNIEGYVIQFEDGTMAKMKTKWYLGLHRSVVFNRERDVARMVVYETVDDFKSFAVNVPELFVKIVEIERRVAADLLYLESVFHHTVQILEENSHLDREQKFMLIKDTIFCKNVLRYHYGAEVDISQLTKEFFIKEMLSNYSLIQI